MAKKVAKKKAKKRVRQNWCQMVIRVRVPVKDVPDLKVWKVTGAKGSRLYDLEISNAYYDYAKLKSPDAMPRT
jgi:hypothetical protein